ncbi:MAG: antitoxin [Kutzneria sp.]|nr:antitoxin [Kutzneria sp.]
MTRTIQIRDVDERTYTVLRTRAAAESLSLTAYLKRQLERMASGPTMAELLERADLRRARGVGVSGEDLITAVRGAREEGDH